MYGEKICIPSVPHVNAYGLTTERFLKSSVLNSFAEGCVAKKEGIISSIIESIGLSSIPVNNEEEKMDIKENKLWSEAHVEQLFSTDGSALENSVFEELNEKRNAERTYQNSNLDCSIGYKSDYSIERVIGNSRSDSCTNSISSESPVQIENGDKVTHLNDPVIINGEKRFVCQICKSTFRRRDYLREHFFKHTKDYPYICSVCGDGFGKKSRLRSHEKVHSKEKPYSCSLCPKFFKRKETLEAHILRHSEEIFPKNKNNISCDSCAFTCTSYSVLKQHQRKHTGEKPYLCHYCVASFASNASLTYHLRIHTGERPYVCDECDATFTQQGNLTNHRLIHSGEKRFVCDVCQSAFVNKSRLRSHLVSHSVEKRFSCHICQGKFKHKLTLKSHMRVHTGETPYSCKFCGVSFKQSSILWRHLRIHK